MSSSNNNNNNNNNNNFISRGYIWIYLEKPNIEHAASGLPDPTHLEGEVRDKK